jgi:competence protein ComEC
MDDLPESSMQAFQALGIIHVLSVSGFHLGLIWVGMLGLLPLVPRAARGLVTLIALAVVWAFVAVVGFAPSAIRSAAMITVVGIIGLGGNRPRGIDAFALAQVGLLAFFPKMAYQLGFQLSSAAVLGLILASPPAASGLKSNKLLAGLRTSLAAQWATTPLALPIFHSMPLTFLLSNFLLVPPLLMVYPYSILAFCGLPMPDPEPLLEGLARIASDPRLVWADRFPTPTQTALLVFYALAGLLALRNRRPWIVAAALAFTALVLAQSGPRLHREQRWIALGRGIACIQVRGDSVRIYGTKYLLANDFLWTRSMQPYFKSRGIKYLEKHPRSFEVMEQGLRAQQMGLGHEVPKRDDLPGLSRVVNPQNLGSAF